MSDLKYFEKKLKINSFAKDVSLGAIHRLIEKFKFDKSNPNKLFIIKHKLKLRNNDQIFFAIVISS